MVLEVLEDIVNICKTFLEVPQEFFDQVRLAFVVLGDY